MLFLLHLIVHLQNKKYSTVRELQENKTQEAHVRSIASLQANSIKMFNLKNYLTELI